MRPVELCFLSIAEASRLLARREISPLDLVRATLDRIESATRFHAAFIEVTAERALAEARRAESEIAHGQYRGRLHGIPIALKDIFDTAGLVTTAGSKLWNPPPAQVDSEVARRFDQAGAILIGKTNLHEFVYGGTNLNRHFGTPPNPWDRKRVPGGSSGGSAVAVALGMAFAAMGSDTGGSIRGPASYCGVTGLKPTLDLVSRRGVTPVSTTLDTVGPMARSALDCAIALSAIAGFDPDYPYSAEIHDRDYTVEIEGGVQGLRIGVPTNLYVDGLEPGVEELVRAAIGVLGGLGARIVDVDLSWAAHGGSSITRVEFGWFHRERLADPSVAKEMRKGTLTRMWRGRSPDAGQYYADLQRIAEIRRRSSALLREVDLIANPSTPRTAPPIVEAGTLRFLKSHRFFGGLFNQAGQPSISIPCGFTKNGLPVGLMLSGGHWKDGLVLRAAHAYQRATDWHLRRPPMA